MTIGSGYPHTSALPLAAQARGPRLVTDGAAANDPTPPTRRERVAAFHEAFGQYVGYEPHTPPVDVTRLRLRLIAEEFCELLQASFYAPTEIDDVTECIMDLVKNAPVDVELVDVVDALADIDYVTEGFRQALGVDGAPIEAEVHRTNMAKLGAHPGAPGRIELVKGKVQKPAGWVGPDIAGCLVAQGWKGGE